MGLKDLQIFAEQEAQFAGQTNTLGQSLDKGFDKNPDEYAELLKISAKTGIAPELAKDYKPELVKQDKINSLSLDNIVRTHPKTTMFLSDPDNAAIAQDDIENMTFMETVFQKAKDYGGALGSGVVGKTGGSLLSGAGELYGVASRNLESLLDNVLPNSVMSALRTPIPWFLDPEQVLKRPGTTLKAAGEYMAPTKERQGLDTDVVEGIGQLGGQIAVFLASGGTITAASMYAQGADVMAEKTKDDKADPALRDTAIVAGGAITALTEKYGLDKILNRVPPAIKNRALRFIADKFAAGGIEAAQEVTEGLLHDLTRRVLTEENAPILEGALREGTAAGLSAAIVRAALGVRPYRQAKMQEEMVKAMAGDSKLRDRLPEKYQQFIASVSQDGPVQNAFIPVEQFTTFFQSQNMDPEQMAESFGATNYREALAAGSEVVIPIDQFAAKVAPTDYLQGLMADIKFDQNAMTARERELAMANLDQQERDILANMEAIVAEQQKQGGINAAIEAVVKDIEGQLVSIGTDARTARDQATTLRGVAVLVERDLRGRAQAEGRELTDQDVFDAVSQVWDRYGLTVTRQIPDVLTSAPTSDINIDPLIDALRGNDFPTDAQIYGKSLAEFIRDSGGLVAMGETLTADENMERRPFQAKLVQPTGMTIEQALERAVQAGYFPGSMPGDLTEADFLNALDDDLRGGGVYSPMQGDTDLLARKEGLNSLYDYLTSIGVDLNAMDNAQVRQAMDLARQTPEGEMAAAQAQETAARLFQAENFFGENEVKRVLKREPGQFNEIEQAAFDEFLSTRADADRILANLEEHKGTPWAKQAVEGIFTRQAMRMLIAGQTPNFQSSMDSTQVRKVRETLQKRGIDGVWSLLEADGGMIGSAAKPVNNVNSSFVNCDPSKDCAKYCYATKGNYQYANVIVKSELVTLAVELDPVRSGQRVANEYKATAEFMANKALRLFDKGDGNMAWLPFINELNKQGVRVQIFSKVPEFLRAVPDMNLRLLSIDDSNMDMADANPDLPVAFVYTGKSQIDMLAKLAARNQIQVVLPVKLGQKLLDGTEITDLKKAVPEVKPYLCPIDAGFKKLGKTSQPGAWNCTKCDVNGGVGCFHGSATKMVMQSLEAKPATQQERAKRILELRSQINAITAGTAGDLAQAGRVPQGGVEGLLLEVDSLLGELLRDYDTDAKTGATVEIGRGVTDATGGAEGPVPGRRVIPIQRLYQSAGSGAAAGVAGRPADVKPTFYSALQRAFEGAKQESMPANQWVSWINSNAGQLGVKKDEIEWTGINDYLALRGKEKVTKAEISEYLAANGVQVEEVVLWAEESGMDLDDWLNDWADNNPGETADAILNGEPWNELEKIARANGDTEVVNRLENKSSPSKYDTYTLPGGENYREILLTLPTQEQKRNERFRQIASEMLTATPERYLDLLAERTRLYNESQTADFKSSHWDQKNVLAHIRVNDRVDADGKRVLFVEEIQSDWGQEGKKKGFAASDTTGWKVRGTNESDPSEVEVLDAQGQSVWQGIANGTDRQIIERAAQAGIPAAPFVTKTEGWLNLALKRIAQMAVEGGYDRVAFVNGEQSADRYDLSKQISSIAYNPEENILDAWDLNRRKVMRREITDESQLEDYVGKEVAKRLLEQPLVMGKHLLDGEDIKVGGEGMKTFYDKIVPNAVSTLIKKMDSKLETVEVGTPIQTDMSISDMLKELGLPEQQWLDMPFSEKEKLMDDYAAKNKEKTSQQLGFTVTDKMRETVTAGLPLFQGQNMDDKRGFIQFGPSRKFNITLLEKANRSTFLHEVGHFYLEVMGDLATAPGASEAITQDYAKVLKFLGLESREQLTLDGKDPNSAEFKLAVEAHEKWARANEAYLMEGNAPTPELQDVFQRFKAWMTLIYKALTSLNVQLTNEVREVFDRIYATDLEIQAAKAQVNVEALFLDAKAAGMSQQEFELYRQSVAQATESAKESLTVKLMRELQRERETWWKERRAEMRKDVEVEVDSQLVYQAFKALVAGKMDDDTNIKLNKQSLVDKYGIEYVKRLPRGFQRIYTTQGGMDADTAAEFLGYNSGDALIEAIVGMRDRKELIEAETDQRMRDTYGDMLNDGSIADEAKIALHNKHRENLLVAELRALRRKQREVAPFVQAERQAQREDRRQARAATQTPPVEAFRRAAKGIIGQTALRDIRPNTYLLASRKAARQAFDAMAKGDYMLAADAKQKEILNHFLYIEANKARQEADKILKYAQKFEKGTTREAMGKAGGTYLEQIDALLDRYEFRRVPLSKIDRRQSLSDWIAEQEAAGGEPSIDPVLLNESRLVNYKQASMDELRAVYDAVRNIEHLARYKNKLLAKQKDIQFADAIAELVAAAENMTAGKGDKAKGTRKPLPLDMSAMTMREKAGDTVSRFDAMLLKMEQVVEWLDNGDVNGPWHTYLWNPIAEAQNNEYDITRQLTEKIAASLEKMPKEQRLSMLDTYEIPGMGKVTRKFLISVALNMGNQGNIDKMMRGMGWDMATIERGLAKLNDADWTFVQETWDTINSIWPQIAELEKRMTGLEPPKVEAQPYEVRDEQGNVVRTLPGGYYPLVYDPRKSEQGAKQEAGNLGQMFEEGYVRATTPKGHTQARMEGFAAPILLDFEQVVTQHLAKVVKDLTHREAVVQANKILTNREIRSVLQETLGPAYEKQMLPWLRSVVNDRNGGSVQGLTDFSRWMMTARANVVAAVMGFKATTMIAQITGLSQSLDKVQGKYLSQALLEYLRHPIQATRYVRDLSGEMRNRANTLDRDIRDQLRNLTGQNSTYAQAQRFAFHGIAIVDAMVTVPTWLGAYRQALAEGKSEETARLEADAAVRMTQGSGGAKDLSAIQRNNELSKTLTMFYSYFNVLYNRMRDMGRDVQEIRDMPRFLSRVFFTVMVPAVLGELILGRGPDEDEDPAAWTIRKVLLYPFMSIPVLRDVVSSIDSGFDYRFSPMATVFEKIGKAATSTGKVIQGDMEWGDYSLRVAETIGYVFGIGGTAQISSTGKYLWRVSEGEENPDNMAELLAYALLGKMKED